MNGSGLELSVDKAAAEKGMQLEAGIVGTTHQPVSDEIADHTLGENPNLVDFDEVSNQLTGLFADQDVAGLCCLLEARRQGPQDRTSEFEAPDHLFL
jgi:hypothetical protein